MPDVFVCDVFPGGVPAVFAPLGFFSVGAFFGSTPCVTSCSGVPAVLLPTICSAPVGAITPVSTLRTVSCGSNTNLTFRVTNTLGLLVPDGTSLGFTATLGRVTPTAATTSGEATASVIIPPRTAGTDTITITSGTVTTQYTLSVTC